MSKLIVNTGSLMSGGAERVLSTLSRCFADNYDLVYFVLWLDHRFPSVFYKIDSRVKIIYLSKASNSTNRIKQMMWYRRFVVREKPTIVLSFMVMINYCVMASLFGTSIPIVVSERNDPRFFHRGPFLRRIINTMYGFSNVKQIVLQTQNNKDYFTKKLQEKSVVIYNPIQIDSNLLGIALRTEKKNKIVTVARLEPQKHINILIESFKLFFENHRDYQLVIYGDGSCRVSLENQIQHLGMSKSIILAGSTSDVFHSIKDAKVFIMSSLYEGMSNSLIEAMCAGLPCVSTKVSGATDLIKDSVNGCLVDIDDIYGLSQAMTRIVDNPSFAYQIGEQATKVYNFLKLSIIEKEWINVLKK